MLVTGLLLLGYDLAPLAKFVSVSQREVLNLTSVSHCGSLTECDGAKWNLSAKKMVEQSVGLGASNALYVNGQEKTFEAVAAERISTWGSSAERRPAMAPNRKKPMILLSDHRGNGLPKALQKLAQAGAELQGSEQLRDTCTAVASGRAELVVLAPLSPSGKAEFEALEGSRQENGTPILVVAEPGRREALRNMGILRAGPSDLIYSDAPLEEFILRIAALRAQARKGVELEQMRFRASHDDRTQLLRPDAFQSAFERQLSAAERHGQDLALLMLDLDRFGQINKRLNHMAGDRVIEAVGKVLRTSLRNEDLAGRLGGDEFAVVLPYTTPQQAELVAERLRRGIAALTGTLHGHSDQLPVGASMGLSSFGARFSERGEDSLEQLRERAEQGLRRAKELGGNQVVALPAPGLVGASNGNGSHAGFHPDPTDVEDSHALSS